MKKVLFILSFFLSSSFVFSQSTITGTVTDGELNAPLSGANIIEVGTSNGTMTDFNGTFSINTTSSSGELLISFVGYKSLTLSFDGSTDLGSISLLSDNSLDEVIVLSSGVIDLAVKRKTPVAVSTISSSEISLRVGNQEFPEIMNRTPGVYATKQEGGYGDSRISLRGFDQTNTSFLINGQPVNDMENGRVFWSNWQGLTDIASGIQIQRGLGATRLAIPSVGGTVSIFTKATEAMQSSSISQMVGNDGYYKTTASYSSGKNESGWASSFLLSKWAGDGYIYNTSGEGTTYFMAVGYNPEGSKHSMNFSLLGAGQWHHQRDVWVSIRDYQNFGDSGIDQRWNSNGGTLNGEEFNMRRNFYNKPLVTFNWDWEISDKVTLNTSLYGSAGRGGGTGPRGQNWRNSETDILPFRKDLTEHYLEDGRGPRDANGFIDYDALINYQLSNTDPYTGSISDYDGMLISSNGFSDDGVNNAGLIRRASINSHDWVGAISNLEINSGNWRYSVGIDLRSYKGYHYRALNDLMGFDGYYSTGNDNSAGQIINTTIDASPFNSTGIKGPKIDYYNVGNVGWFGFNGLIEYSKDDKFTSVLQAGLSNQSFEREDYFDSPLNPISEKKDITGGYIKGGSNYNIDDKSNVYFNAGYISRQPNFDGVFPNYANTVNPDLQNEEITSVELGYGFASDKVRLNVNLYSTNWGNRFISRGISNQQGVDGTAQFKDVDVLHNGLEIEATYFATEKLTLRGMLSAGDWKYTKDFSTELFDDNQQSIGTGTLYLKDAKVGDAAQFVTYLEGVYRTGIFSFDFGYRFVDNLYADYSVTDSAFLEPDNPGALKLPSFGLADLGTTVNFDLFGTNASFRLNINNLFNTVYIAESNSNIHVTDDTVDTWKGIDTTNSVWFGFGTTWNGTLRINF